jgi:transposase
MIAKYSKAELESMSSSHVIHAFLEMQKHFFEDQWKEIEVKKDSTNSSIPPSKDSFWKKKAKNTSREKSGKKSWGQPWHTGITREHEKPTEIIDLKPTHCYKTNTQLTSKNSIWKLVSKRVIVDIEVKKRVIEYRVRSAEYKGEKTEWVLPSWITTSHMQLWPILNSIVLYSSIYQKIPQERMCQMLKDVFDIKTTQWTINNILARWWAKAKSMYTEIKEKVKTAICVWWDETWNKINGKLCWIWLRQTKERNYYHPSLNRSFQSVKDWIWEDGLEWVFVHDCYSAQNNTQAKEHQLCLEHIKRDMKYCIAEWLGHSDIWWTMLRTLKRSWKAQEWLIDGRIDVIYQEQIAIFYEQKMRELCLKCEMAKWKIRAIAKRIIKHMDKMFVFLRNLVIPRHNNASEKWLRMQKLHEKISWWFRSLLWAKIHCMILSLIESMKKQKRSIMEMLYLLVTDKFVLLQAE